MSSTGIPKKRLITGPIQLISCTYISGWYVPSITSGMVSSSRLTLVLNSTRTQRLDQMGSSTYCRMKKKPATVEILVSSESKLRAVMGPYWLTGSHSNQSPTDTDR